MQQPDKQRNGDIQHISGPLAELWASIQEKQKAYQEEKRGVVKSDTLTNQK